jgi:hypothetical protein
MFCEARFELHFHCWPVFADDGEFFVALRMTKQIQIWGSLHFASLRYAAVEMTSGEGGERDDKQFETGLKSLERRRGV